jgi:outer membrane protein OmpA-like peptidoglycan-associated protein
MTPRYKSAAILFTFGAIILSTYCNAQPVYDYKKSADRFYAEGDYFSAAEYYEKSLEQKDGTATTEPYTVQKKGAKAKAGNNRQEVVYRIAESYRLINNYTKAEKWYAEARGFDKAAFPLAQYWYGVSLRSNGKYADAEQHLNEFVASYTSNDVYKEQARLELADVKFIRQQLARTDLDQYQVAGLNVNTVGADYAASWNNNGLVFTSTRADSIVAKQKNRNPHINNLYQAESTDGVFGAAQKLAIPVQDGMEQGVASFSPSGDRIYFTRWTQKGDKNLALIYVSQQTAGSWSAPVPAGGRINIEGYSSQQPHVTADGNYLLFASDRPGGNGGFDLYYASIKGTDAPTSVNNFGSMINTKADDQSAFYHSSTQTLVFATKGRVGMGGYDLFESHGAIGSGWTEPRNLGYPVNSIKDDLYFFTRSNEKLLQGAILSSDRSSECCLQLVTVNKVYKKYVTGLVTDCNTSQPLSSANVQVNGNDGRSLYTLVTDNNGTYRMEVLAFQAMNLIASKESYKNGSIDMSQAPANTDSLVIPAICLSPVVVVAPDPEPQPEEKKKDLKVYFDFAKYSLRPETGVLLDTLVALLKRETKLGIEIYGYTDQKGSDGYNANLSRLRAEACKDYFVRNGISASRLTVLPKGECCGEKNERKPDGSDDPAARQLNRRVEFKIILMSL